jgi:hypothetical protein
MKNFLQLALLVALTPAATTHAQPPETTQKLFKKLATCKPSTSYSSSILCTILYEHKTEDQIQKTKSKINYASPRAQKDENQIINPPQTGQRQDHYSAQTSPQIQTPEQAQEPQIPSGENWPQPAIPAHKPLQTYEQLWTRSPFIIATPATNSPIQQNPRYTLASIVKIGNEYYAHVIETATQRRLPVSKNPAPDHGLLLIDVYEAPTPSSTTATISVQGQPVTIGFDSSFFNQPMSTSVTGSYNNSPHSPSTQPYLGYQTQTLTNKQNFLEQTIQTQSPPPPPSGYIVSKHNNPSAVTPPNITSTRNIVRRRAYPHTDAQKHIPSNLEANPPPQE